MWRRRLLGLDKKRDDGGEAEREIDEMEIPNECPQPSQHPAEEADQKEDNFAAPIKFPFQLMNFNDIGKPAMERSRYEMGADEQDNDVEEFEEHVFSKTHFGQVYSVFGYKSAQRRCGTACGNVCEFET